MFYLFTHHLSSRPVIVEARTYKAAVRRGNVDLSYCDDCGETVFYPHYNNPFKTLEAARSAADHKFEPSIILFSKGN